MKKIFVFILFIFITNAYSDDVVYNTDLIKINSLEYNKTAITIFKPCILNKYLIDKEIGQSMEQLDNLINTIETDSIDDSTTDNKVYKSTNMETISIQDMYTYYENKNIDMIYNKILSNLLKTELYDIDYDEYSCPKINDFFINNNTKDVSEYILSDSLSTKGYILTTDIELLNKNEAKIQVFLWDTIEQRFLDGKYYILDINNALNKDNYDRVANMISDFIFKYTTGESSGIFDSKIIYVSETGNFKNRKKQINIMNFDGSKNTTITSGSNLKLTPIFSKYDKDEVFYLEYTKDGVFIIKHNLKTNSKYKVTAKKQNMTSAPNFNPSGENQLVIAGSEENKGTNLFLFDFDKGTNRKMTNNKYINTAASFSPDGNKIVYVSDKNGGKKLFVIDLENDEETLISLNNGLYDKPAWSPDGRLIAFVKMIKGKFYLGIMTTTGEGERFLTSDYLIEGVRWAPNSRYLIYTKQSDAFGEGSIPKIYIMDILTMNEYKLNTPEGEGASDPDWILNK